jgi:hypothetical protein
MDQRSAVRHRVLKAGKIVSDGSAITSMTSIGCDGTDRSSLEPNCRLSFGEVPAAITSQMPK